MLVTCLMFKALLWFLSSIYRRKQLQLTLLDVLIKYAKCTIWHGKMILISYAIMNINALHIEGDGDDAVDNNVVLSM